MVERHDDHEQAAQDVDGFEAASARLERDGLERGGRESGSRHRAILKGELGPGGNLRLRKYTGVALRSSIPAKVARWVSLKSGVGEVAGDAVSCAVGFR